MIKLNEKQEIILMHIRDGKSQREIARITGKDRKTIRKYIKEYEGNRRTLIEHGGADDKEIINAIVDKPKYDVSGRKKKAKNDIHLSMTYLTVALHHTFLKPFGCAILNIAGAWNAQHPGFPKKCANDHQYF